MIAFEDACAVFGIDFQTWANTSNLVMPCKATQMPS